MFSAEEIKGAKEIYVIFSERTVNGVALLLFIQALAINILSSVFHNNIIAIILYFIAYSIEHIVVFTSIRNKLPRNLLSVIPTTLAYVYPMLFGINRVLVVIAKDSLLQVILSTTFTIIGVVFFIVFGVLLFKHKNIGKNKTLICAISSICLAISYIIDPVLVVFTSWIFYGSLYFLLKRERQFKLNLQK